MDLLALDFMRNSLIAALLVGASAPLVGVFLVQRGMSLVGDGMGHVALAGVGIGVLTSTSPCSPPSSSSSSRRSPSSCCATSAAPVVTSRSP